MKHLLLACLVLAEGCAPSAEAFPPEVVARARDESAAIDETALRDHVARVVEAHRSETPQPSEYGEAAGLTRTGATEYLVSELRSLGLAPEVERAGAGASETTNVRCDLPGERPQLVLVTGHLDAWYQSGADDNASALAVMLEVARLLRARPHKRTIRIVGFDREEEGAIGSGRYLDAHRSDDVRIVLNMDCVGFASDTEGSQDAPPGLGLRDRGDFLAVLSNAPARNDASRVVRLSSELPGAVDTLGVAAPADGRFPATAEFLRSDHTTFWLADIPALFFTDTADLRNKNYHTPDDTPDTLDYAFLARAARLVVAAAAAFADAD